MGFFFFPEIKDQKFSIGLVYLFILEFKAEFNWAFRCANVYSRGFKTNFFFGLGGSFEPPNYNVTSPWPEVVDELVKQIFYF